MTAATARGRIRGRAAGREAGAGETRTGERGGLAREAGGGHDGLDRQEGIGMMKIVDSHLDLAMNALIWNRDLTRTVEETQGLEAGMKQKGRGGGWWRCRRCGGAGWGCASRR